MNKKKQPSWLVQRDDFVRDFGFTIISIQYFEFTMSLALHAIQGEYVGKFTLTDLTSGNEKLRLPAIGSLLKELRKSMSLDSTFEWRFNKFMEKRNYAIHRLFIEVPHEGEDMPTSIAKKRRYLKTLDGEIDYFTGIFRGFVDVMLEHHISQSPDLLSKEINLTSWNPDSLHLIQALLRKQGSGSKISQSEPWSLDIDDHQP